MANLSHDKSVQRDELVREVLVPAIMDKLVGLHYTDPDGTELDFGNYAPLYTALDRMAASDDDPIWSHFKPIHALPAVIKLYRSLT